MDRRGSGYSIPLKGNGTNPNFMSQGAFYPPPMQPIYIQSPAYPPMMMQQGMGGHPSSYGPPYHSYSYGYPGAMMGPPLRRAGSINAKIMSQDAKRPFAQAQQHPRPWSDHSSPWMDDGAGMGALTGPEDRAPSVTSETDPTSVLERLKRENEENRQGFKDKMKFWEATKPRMEDMDQQIKVF